MLLGISSYSLDRDISAGRLSLLEAIDYAAKIGAECMELVPFAFRFWDPESGEIDQPMVDRVRKRAADAGIKLVNYSILGNLALEGEELQKEVKRIKREVDVVAALGIPSMRHDISFFRRSMFESTVADFDRLLPQFAEQTALICEYAKGQGVRTLLENHGFFVNGCDRVERIINAVNHENYGLLLDTGNIICVDEDPSVACAQLARLCKMVHLKDFYVRHQDPGDTTQFDCAGRWFRSRGGKYLRGSIVGQGDLDIAAAIRALKAANYDGPIAIEFEGMEDAQYATAVGLHNARRLWDEA